MGSFLLTIMVTAFLQRKYKTTNMDEVDLGKHFIDFLFFYGNQFNYEDLGISIRKGGFLFPKHSRGWQGYDEKTRMRLCVENPQDPSLDIGKSAYNIKKVQRAFQHAYDMLVLNNANSLSLLKLIITTNPEEIQPSLKEKELEYKE